MNKISLIGKAGTLDQLVGRLKNGRVLPLNHFSVSKWKTKRLKVLESLEAESWIGQALIIRSSAATEDCSESSNAGVFKSTLDIYGIEAAAEAIDAVVDSYRSSANDPKNRILVQPMLSDVSISGVAFTCDPATGAPYQIINYHVGSDTAAVTSGTGRGLRTFVRVKNPEALCPTEFQSLFPLLDELESLTGLETLDVEFAIDGEGTVFLFQVRPLIITKGGGRLSDIKKTLRRVAEKVRTSSRPHPFILGSKVVYGIMPDWNPAEIIGVRPRPLAVSLYRELITDSIWAYQRHNYGYRNLRSAPLMVDFEGLPYVDVRVSFNSFIPHDLEEDIAQRLVSYYTERLISEPALHDKIEFDIVFSCYHFDLDSHLAPLTKFGFLKHENSKIKNELLKLTNKIIKTNGLWKQDAERLLNLDRRYKVLNCAKVDPITKIYWLLEDCKRYGTLPFAGLARGAFVATQMLRSLVCIGVLSEQNLQDFLSSIDTIGTNIGNDLSELSRENFLKKYGHLRPGTYDILSSRFDETPDLYFDFLEVEKPLRRSKPFVLSPKQKTEIERLIQFHKLETTADELFEFFSGVIRGREHAKFLFSRNVSKVLVHLDQLFAKMGLTREDASYLDIRAIYQLHSSTAEEVDVLTYNVSKGREQYARTENLILPPILHEPDQVYAFEVAPSEPNFITRKRFIGPVCRFESTTDFTNAIVLISNADPGFDWIFTKKIGGFLTAYGGANSHMAVRANELGIPAAIGVGEANFDLYRRSHAIDLDCANRRIIIVS